MPQKLVKKITVRALGKNGKWGTAESCSVAEATAKAKADCDPPSRKASTKPPTQ